MDKALVVGLLAGFGTMLGWGGADFFAKKTIDAIGSIKTLVWGHLFGTILFLLAALLRFLKQNEGIHFPPLGSQWLALIFFGTLQMIVYWLLYEAFNKGQLAILNPIFSSYSGLVALVSVLFLGEKLTAGLGIALFIIFCGIILMNLDFKELRSPKLKIAPGLKEVLIAAALATAWTLLWDKFVANHDALSYALLMYTFMTLAAFGLARVLKSEIKGVPHAIRRLLFLIGLGEAMAYLSLSWGLRSTRLTSVVVLVAGTFSIPTVILAVIFLKEKLARTQVVAIITVVSGLILLLLS